MAAKSILVVDDDSDLRLMLCELFDSYGAKCVGVASLEEMKDLGANGQLPFDLVILDVNLGQGQPSGIDAYRWLKDHSFSGCVLFMTGHARSFPGVADAYAVGIRVLQKPVSIDDLLNLLRESGQRSQSPPDGEAAHHSKLYFHPLV
jgi:DNA-binding response OmpR family regulator